MTVEGVPVVLWGLLDDFKAHVLNVGGYMLVAYFVGLYYGRKIAEPATGHDHETGTPTCPTCGNALKGA